MQNKLTQLFKQPAHKLLNVYCTAGYPTIDSTATVMLSLQKAGVDMIEVGMPYSDPIADGPVIQESNMVAIENGMTIQVLFEQLQQIKEAIHIPIILMGYLNPVLQFGIEKFCKAAADAGVSGIILPDLPMHEYETMYRTYFEKNNLSFVFLITPQTSDERIKKADALSTGFIYAVSSSATTGTAVDSTQQLSYFKRLASLKINNKIMIGFGIHNKASFDNAAAYGAGAIIGSAFIKAIGKSNNIAKAVQTFIKNIR
ncbi:tryptophan synthase subunit alpha [Ferruginibacter yonginensis]|uniref:Tryptophan synthase alpha chain n=1 Tax=Ferruginibacter yonginensis TaxID=1310416 RepID=A0ABV8QQQ4_9BACT